MTVYSPALLGADAVAGRAAAPAKFQQRSLIARLALALSVSAERRALAEATPERLADLGLTEEQARAEAARPIWDLPKGR